MANKKKPSSNSPIKKQHHHPQPNGAETKDKNNNQEEEATIATTKGASLWLCLLVGLCSLSVGLLSPHLLQQRRPVSATTSSRHSSSFSNHHQKMSRQLQHEFSCDKEALSTVLHEKRVPGMHVVCMDQTMTSLKLTFWPGAQHTEAPPKIELQGLPEWDLFKRVIGDNLHLGTGSDDFNRPWGMFSPQGELLVQETNPHVNMAGLVQMGMVLVFQGGQFVWPGVRIGYKRTIPLYNVMPAGSPPMDPSKNRTATLETLSLEPLVFSVEGFLDDHECDWIQQEALPTLQYSQVTLMDMDKGRPASDFRTSQSTFLAKNDHPIVQDIDYRTASLVRIPRSHQENVQVLRYRGGEKYDAHHDYFDPSLYKQDRNTLKNFIQFGRRNRMITVFWYLSDVAEGGETIFPLEGGRPPPLSAQDCSAGLKVKPRRGRVIIFYSMKPDGSLDPLSLHGACPVKDGVKWAANKWVWNAPIEFGSGN